MLRWEAYRMVHEAIEALDADHEGKPSQADVIWKVSESSQNLYRRMTGSPLVDPTIDFREDLLNMASACVKALELFCSSDNKPQP